MLTMKINTLVLAKGESQLISFFSVILSSTLLLLFFAANFCNSEVKRVECVLDLVSIVGVYSTFSSVFQV